MCIITAVVDMYRPRADSKSSLIYPEMGVYTCFLGKKLECCVGFRQKLSSKASLAYPVIDVYTWFLG
jgi:hypothetical protein